MAIPKTFGTIRNKATGETLVEMIGPGRDDDALSVGLRILTHQLQLKFPNDAGFGGLFGGRYGYGMDFKNDVFEMHPDWQGDCTCGASEPIHSEDCRAVFDKWLDARNHYGIVPSTDEEREAEIAESIKRGMSERMARFSACARPWSFERVEEYERANPRPECICEARNWVERDEHDPECKLEQHCFTYKPTGLIIDWYKYIGRDNEQRGGELPNTWAEMFEACLASIGAPSLDVACAQYEAAEKEEAESFKRSMKFFLGADQDETDDAVAGKSE